MRSTRVTRATALREKIARGPSRAMREDGRDLFTGAILTAAQHAESYQLWVETWILPELDALIPELRARNESSAEHASDDRSKHNV